MISSVSDYTCTMITNDQTLSLTARKRRAALKAVNEFARRVHALFEWQNCSKVAFAFVFALDVFAFALCIIRPCDTIHKHIVKRHSHLRHKQWKLLKVVYGSTFALKNII